MNVRALRRQVCLGLFVVTLSIMLSGCTGAGPAASPGASRPRCGSGSASDEQRPLFFIFCIESP